MARFFRCSGCDCGTRGLLLPLILLLSLLARLCLECAANTAAVVTWDDSIVSSKFFGGSISLSSSRCFLSRRLCFFCFRFFFCFLSKEDDDDDENDVEEENDDSSSELLEDESDEWDRLLLRPCFLFDDRCLLKSRLSLEDCFRRLRRRSSLVLLLLFLFRELLLSLSPRWLLSSESKDRCLRFSLDRECFRFRRRLELSLSAFKSLRLDAVYSTDSLGLFLDKSSISWTDSRGAKQCLVFQSRYYFMPCISTTSKKLRFNNFLVFLDSFLSD